ncbi:hypothetical protein N0V86_006994 [Didymella sp. IMI 355093]|nr:hypothetical protein N0V86_006994 [Didymella sp. IMI 355093]
MAMKEDISPLILLSSVKSKVNAYVPSPPSGSIGAFPKYMATLNAEQRESISQFIQATKEPTSVAIQTLKECDWDLLEAISRFGGDEDDDCDAQDHPEKERVQTRTVECELGVAEDEEIVNEDCIWQPSYVVRFRDFGQDPETRLISHVEFLAGRPGALTEAYELRKTAKYGSLRCVLGDLVQWMLMNNHRYSFLVSSDEIMYLRLDVEQVKEKGRTVFYEPRLHYSQPAKITGAFDPEAGTITVRMGLLYLFYLVIRDREGSVLPEEMGYCLNYAAWTQEERDLEIRAPCVPESCKKKE